MPLLLFEGRSGKFILPILRPGHGNKSINIAGLLKRLILKLRGHWKHTQIIDRGDTHFCSNDFMDQILETSAKGGRQNRAKNGLKADRISPKTDIFATFAE